MKTFQVYLPEGARSYNCAHCRANLADHHELISKVSAPFNTPKYVLSLVIPRKPRKGLFVQFCVSYRIQYGSTIYFSVNVGCGPAEERVLLTGLHEVADIYCECCKTTLGWKYVSLALLMRVTFLVEGARLRVRPEV